VGLIHFSSLMNLTLRQAVSADIPALRVLIDASVRGLQTADYTPAQIEGALQTIYGVDSQLIADGTYYIVEEISETALIVGCGGWSKRKTLFGGDRWTRREDSLLNPQQDAAKIRAFFVHPDWVRRGIGRMILETCEKAAAAAGFTRFEMGATLTGVPLYRASGYVQIERLDVPLKNGESLAVIRMEKRMGSPK
jgi:GNAT superfamily N-acetyltransferase